MTNGVSSGDRTKTKTANRSRKLTVSVLCPMLDPVGIAMLTRVRKVRTRLVGRPSEESPVATPPEV